MKHYLISLIFPFIFPPFAHAGENAIEAAAAFKTNGSGLVEQASISVGIGKNNAHADAKVTATGTEALAVGTGGTITLSTGGFYVESVSPETPSSLQQPQNNEVNQDIQIDVITGTTNPNPLP